MFNFFKKPLPPSPLESQPTPRAVLPTYVTDKVVVLSKAGPSIRNTYEIRLALFMAKSRNLRFILAVRPCTLVETSVRDLLAEHDGLIEETQMGDFCVSVGWGYEEGENEGWVLGDAAALAALVGEVRSGRLREFLIPGGARSGSRSHRNGSGAAARELVCYEHRQGASARSPSKPDCKRKQEWRHPVHSIVGLRRG